VNDSGSTPKNVAVTVPVLVNDSDPDGDVLTIISVSRRMARRASSAQTCVHADK